MRSRNIKPDFFIDEDLAELPFETRLLFIGLWCAADREGRVEDRPKRIKAQVFPNDNVNIDKMLAQLQKSGHVIRYTSGGVNVVQVKNFAKHQSPHHTERASVLPCFNGEAPEFNREAPDIHASSTVEIPLIPDSGSLIPDRGLASTKSVDGLAGFSAFWQAYPRKTGKGAAEKAWAKVPRSAHRAIMDAIEKQKGGPDWMKDGGQFIPHPATWLNQRRWEDEIMDFAERDIERRAQLLRDMG